MRIIRRNTEIPNRGGFCDLVWSDPEEVNGWELSPRGAGWLFGENVTRGFCHTNNLSLICRAHQLIDEGYRFMFNNLLVTIWSAPNYCYRCGNVAAVMTFNSTTDYTTKVFEAVSQPENNQDRQAVCGYFL
uniref:protein-serine/threonine phosphatase n=1 Tax=Myxobolus squamalis TaxID=59785 RepID=A0A6B2G6I3_MYXSQ